MAQSSGNISNVVSFGGVDSGSNLNILEGNSQGYFSITIGYGSTSVNQYSPFFKNGVIYQVPNGKTCYVVGAIYTTNSLGVACQLVHSLTSFAVNAVSITSGVYQGGASAQFVYLSNASTSSTPRTFAIPYAFPSQAYPGFQPQTINQVLTLICVER